ncbi:hypothetical protein FACS1894161_2430 [Spirochaetia bacterium]|nr:hypothetical protein FACS1894161_2430 [Spirochaetia bacterium]
MYENLRNFFQKLILDGLGKIITLLESGGGGGGTVDVYARELAEAVQQTANAAQITANNAEATLEFMIQAGEDALPPHPIPPGGIYLRYKEILD